MLNFPNNDTDSALRNKIARLGPQLIRQLVSKWAEEDRIKDFDVIFDNLEQLLEKHGVRTIANMITTRWWPKLSQKQLAQIDVWSILHGTSSTPLVASKCLDYDGRASLIDIHASKLESGLKKAFDRIYHFHFYTEETPNESMYVTRVQLFETFEESVTNTHKPFFFVVQKAHSIIFHSPPTDMNSKLIFQSLESVAGPSLKFERISRRTSSSLKELNTLMGLPSINTTGFGIWSVYSSAEKLEPQPLADPAAHPLHQDPTFESSSPSSKRYVEKVSMLKFKGSSKGVKRKREYLDKRKKVRVYDLNSESEDMEVTKYDSLLPTKKVDFNYIDKETGISIKLSFNGRDVFGGLHELCDKNLIDVEKVPDWLAGDNADQSGTIESGIFIPDQKAGLI